MRRKYSGNWRVALGALLLVIAACSDPNAPQSSPPLVVPPPPPPPAPPLLAYDPAIYVASADGSAAVAITHGWAPVWSPDGKRIAFYRADGLSYVFDIDSAVARPLAEGVMPAWSPDGRRIVVDRRDVLYVVDLASGNPVHLAGGQYPAWSPDGTRIAFNDNRGISVINADGTDYHTIVRHGLDATKYPGITDVLVIRPVWSPDVTLQQIAFTLQDVDHGSPLGAYVMDADGSNVHALSGDAPSDAPSWSPNGKQIAFVTWSSAWNGSQYVWSSPGVVVRTHCCEADLLIRVPDSHGVPSTTSWSPDGSVIAFDGSNDIWIGPTGGGDARDFITDATSIAWSRDRQRIAFIRPSERQSAQSASDVKVHR